jgi:hypothetical protein
MRDHFYHPQPSAEDVGGGYWDRISELPGIEIDARSALDLAADSLAPFFAEFRSLFPLHDQGDGRLCLLNNSFMAVDGHMYYGLIRHLRPKRIIEIGAGCSTLMGARACLENGREGPADYTVIEPYPGRLIKNGVPGVTDILVKKAQEVPLDKFMTLEANDILFIDSSHVLRSGNDVHYEYLEILPRLKAGVYVHVHDISLPEEYPAVYYQQQLYWTEQYLLQAFLAFNSRFKVVWPGNYLMVKFPDEMTRLFPEISEMRAKYPQSEPTSFWIRS